MSKIEWTDKTWNPVTGCTKVSQGCKNCYAERMYERFNGKGSFKTITCHEDRLTHPLHWKKPCMVFVNSMSDLFHEDVPFKFIDKVYDYMHAANQHTYQVLTKRAERMLEFYTWKKEGNGFKFSDHWPLANVWIGVSVENQKAADERIPLLLQVPAAVRFLSCEPLLGPIIIDSFKYHYGSFGPVCKACTGKGYYDDNFKTTCTDCDGTAKTPWAIHWIIVDGESGPGARPIHPDWVRSLLDQCKAADVAFFFKQWGEYLPVLDYMEIGDYKTKSSRLEHGFYFEKMGKKKAGRLLDGQLYDEFPKPQTT